MTRPVLPASAASRISLALVFLRFPTIIPFYLGVVLLGLGTRLTRGRFRMVPAWPRVPRTPSRL